MTYLEAKIGLKPSTIVSLHEFHSIGHVVKTTAHTMGIAHSGHPLDAVTRDITFYDSRDCRLFNQGYMVRKRQEYRNGFAYRTKRITIDLRNQTIEEILLPMGQTSLW